MKLHDLNYAQVKFLNGVIGAACRAIRRIINRMEARGWDRDDAVLMSLRKAVEGLSSACADTHRRLVNLRFEQLPSARPGAYTKTRFEQNETRAAVRELGW